VALDADGAPIDSDTDGIPDYLADSNGNGFYDTSDLSEFDTENGASFKLELDNEYVKSTFLPLRIVLDYGSGRPVRMACWIDAVNSAPTNWMPYSSNLIAALGNTPEGWHQLTVLLSRGEGDTQPCERSRAVKIDRTAPALFTTSPVGFDTTLPLIQIKGYCSKSRFICLFSKQLGSTRIYRITSHNPKARKYFCNCCISIRYENKFFRKN